MQNKRNYITDYLKENNVSPKILGYAVLEEALLRALSEPSEPAYLLFGAISQKMNKPSWKSTYRLASYALTPTLEEKQETVMTFIRRGVVVINSRMEGTSVFSTSS